MHKTPYDYKRQPSIPEQRLFSDLLATVNELQAHLDRIEQQDEVPPRQTMADVAGALLTHANNFTVLLRLRYD